MEQDKIRSRPKNDSACLHEFVMMIKGRFAWCRHLAYGYTTISKTIMTSEGNYLVFLPALIIYLIITAIFSYIFGKIEKRLSVYE